MRWIAVCLLIILPIDSIKATGSVVTLRLHSGEHLTGEVLLWLDSMLVLSTVAGLPEATLEEDDGVMILVKIQDIQSLTLRGKSYMADGMLLGMVFGVGVGALMAYTPSGFDTYNSNLDPTGPGATALIIGFLGGAVLGGFLGHLASTSNEDVSPTIWHNIGYLRGLARYDSAEPPDFLHSYILQHSVH